MSDIPPIPPPHRPAAPLDYQGRRDTSNSPSHLKQFFIGFGYWLAGLALLVGMMFAASAAPSQLDFLFIAAVAVPILAEIGIAIYYAGYRGWTHVLVGQLIGLGVTCLLPVGIVAALCWNTKI